MMAGNELVITTGVIPRLNARQERFCQSIIRGSSIVGAYREAYSDLDRGGDPAHDNSHATRVYQHPAVQRRIADLQAAAEVSSEWVVRQAKRVVEDGDSETAKVQALGLLARMFPQVFTSGGAGGVSTRVNVVAAPGSSVNVSTSLGAGLDSAEAREIAETALRSLLAASAPEPTAPIEVEVVDAGAGVTP